MSVTMRPTVPVNHRLPPDCDGERLILYFCCSKYSRSSSIAEPSIILRSAGSFTPVISTMNRLVFKNNSSQSIGNFSMPPTFEPLFNTSKKTPAQHGQHIPAWQLCPCVTNIRLPSAPFTCWSIQQHLQGSSIEPTVVLPACTVNDGRRKQQP